MEKNWAEAVKWFKKAAEQGHMLAQAPPLPTPPAGKLSFRCSHHEAQTVLTDVGRAEQRAGAGGRSGWCTPAHADAAGGEGMLLCAASASM